MLTNLSFERWFENSKVTDQSGRPLLVHRGEHGPIDHAGVQSQEDAKWGPFQSRLGALTFGSSRAAKHYALQPNQQDELPIAPRIFSSYLSTKNPVMNRPNDPFVELVEVVLAVGENVTMKIVIEMKYIIEHTNRWCDELEPKYGNFGEYINSVFFQFEDIYFNAYNLFDSAEYVDIFRRAGFDGVIHGGSGDTFGEAEYKVFSASQALNLFSTRVPYEKLAR